MSDKTTSPYFKLSSFYLANIICHTEAIIVIISFHLTDSLLLAAHLGIFSFFTHSQNVFCPISLSKYNYLRHVGGPACNTGYFIWSSRAYLSVLLWSQRTSIFSDALYGWWDGCKLSTRDPSNYCINPLVEVIGALTVTADKKITL